ncbi:hydroxymethylpyrimidine kinase /phosphomethylpyrimidine kinase [Ciceribacter lividus]|uniref:hydroxymethylpyrimidine kinase n=1 Tax=Ciceribacter lividus TaxID=1197950 RepID=A0A6I7HLH7_9HYPH|nr:bifunctional hydroxymethylpyrimidine kinase/phosphomethylpyrimidine kinase [Ciceribacter lividus]RCW23148.1 hydroxymethylpyrimidine kinase /phosphomethylpyrimidine kinase [Ciceribacter lividus]
MTDAYDMAGRSAPMPAIANALSIAGSDPSGGAGIQADLKTFSARGVYGMAVVTALTAQNTQGVSGIHVVPPDFVAEQIRTVFADIRVDAVKIGMIADVAIAGAVADVLARHREVPVVLDPVMIAKGGASLLTDDAVAALTGRLLPIATVITPNLPEAAALLGEPEACNRDEMAGQALRLMRFGAKAVLVKGGHLPGADSPDVLASAAGLTWFEAPRVATRNTHGTGCTLSSAIAAELAKGALPEEAVAVAKAYVAGAINAADALNVGSGHGPVHHFHALWRDEGAA